MPGAPIRLGELASRLGRTVEGDAGFEVSGAAALDAAGPQDLGFVASPRFAEVLAGSSVGAVILPPDVDGGGRPTIRSPNPRLDFARAVRWILPEVRPPQGVHPTACVAPDAEIDPSASVGPGVAIGAGCRVGARSVLHANVTLYHDVAIGEDCSVHAGVVLREGTRVGDRVVLQPGAVIGGDGFGYAFNEERKLENFPHRGAVVIGDDAEIGANATIDRGALADTRIGSGAKIDNLVVIAHGCDIGDDVAIVAQSGVAGSVTIGPRCLLMAQTGVIDHVTLGADVFVGVRGGVHGDVPEGARLGGVFPAVELRLAERMNAALRRLPQVLVRLRAVERKVGLRPRRRKS